MYKAKSSELIFYNLLLSEPITASNEKNYVIGKAQFDQVAKFFTKNGEVVLKVGAIYKPKVTKQHISKSSEPKTDVLIKTDKRTYKISLKKNSSEAGVANFTTKDSFQNFLNAFVTAGVPGAAIAKSTANNLFAQTIGKHSFYDEKHFDRFKVELNKPKHKCPPNIQAQTILLFQQNLNNTQYNNLITKPQAGLVDWFNNLEKNYQQILDAMILECITGEITFGKYSDASANLVVTMDGVYTPAAYVNIYIKAKYAKGGCVGRVRKMPRASAYQPTESPQQTLQRFAAIAASVHF